MRTFRPLLFPLAALSCCLCVSPPAVRAQTGNDARAVLTDRSAVVVGAPQVLAGRGVIELAVHPEGRYVLTLRQETASSDPLPFGLGAGPRSPGADPVAPEYHLHLWNSRKGKVTTVWRRPATEGAEAILTDLAWLPDSATALLVLATSRPGQPGTEPTMDYELVVVNAAQGNSRTVAMPAGFSQGGGPYVSLHPSPTEPYAVLACHYRTATERRTLLYRVDGSGVGAAPLATVEGPVLLGGWLAGGKTMTGTRQEGDGQDRRWIPVAYDLATKTLRDLPAHPLEKDRAPSAAERAKAAVAALPVRVAGAEAEQPAVTPAATKAAKPAPIPLVYLESAAPADGALPRDRRTLVAADARPEAGGILPDGSAVLYTSRGTLFVAPLHSVDAAAFLAARREAWRRSVVANARQIDSALQQWAMDNRTGMPPPGSDVRALIVGEKGYIRNDSGFHDPATGEWGFTYTYTGRPDAQGRVALFTLRGAGGTYVMYEKGGPDGWLGEEPPAPPAKPGQ